MSSLSSILIVGGTRGIGLEFVRQTAAQHPSAIIYATARNLTTANDLQALADSSNGHIQILTADATDAQSLQLAAQEISSTSPSLDRVIYNAGVLFGWGNPLDVGITPLKENIETNLYGAYNTALYFTPLLLKSTYKHKSLVFLSTNFASFALADEILESHSAAFGTKGYDPSAVYNVSKTALNRLGKELDQVLRPQGLPILLIHPGLVKTKLNPMATTESSESVAKMLKVIDASSTETKLFVDYNGNEVPW